MTYVAWIDKSTNMVTHNSTYGEGVSYVESSTSYPVEVSESSIPEIGTFYNSSTGEFIKPIKPIE